MKETEVKPLLALAIPIFLELLLITIVGNIDVIMLKYYSDNAVGAIGGITQVLNIQNTLFGFINLATSILCSQYIGAKNKEKIDEVITISLNLNIVLGLIMGGVYFIFSENIFELVNLQPQLRELARGYFVIVGGLCVFQAITLTCGAIMKSHGNPKQMLYINIGVNIFNVLGNAIFIFGLFNAPVLGTLGVGISTVVSRGIGCVVGFLVMCKYCNYSYKLKNILYFPIKMMKNILSIGIPTAGENLAWNIGQVLIIAMVNKMGNDIITARTYLMLIANFVMTFSIALGHSASIQVGQLVGAKRNDIAYKKCLESLKLSIFLAFIVTFILTLLRYPVMNYFSDDNRIIELGVKVIPFMILLEVGRVFNIVIINSLHATGDIKFPMMMGILSIFLIAVPFSNILGLKMGFGLVGIWLANALDEWIRGISMLIRWRSRKWEKKSFVD